MVRLKANCKYIVLTDNSISIPYGAIKSIIVSIHIDVQRHFNSLWCD